MEGGYLNVIISTCLNDINTIDNTSIHLRSPSLDYPELEYAMLAIGIVLFVYLITIFCLTCKMYSITKFNDIPQILSMCCLFLSLLCKYRHYYIDNLLVLFTQMVLGYIVQFYP